MLQSNATLDILVNGQRVDILNRSSINLRINNTVYDPTEISRKQAEYSFSFNLPTTPNNNKIFEYANELAKLNKFKKYYSCEVYADGKLIFSGNLRISSIQKGFYNVNLVNIKINSIDDIFGDMKMNELDLTVPYNGAGSINAYNEALAAQSGKILVPDSNDYSGQLMVEVNPSVIFPLVSYGAFQKSPSSTQYDYNFYTSKFQLDKWNQWFHESFNPSPRLIDVVKRYFEQKGFILSGDVLNDEVITNLYMSTNIADEQKPVYNLGAFPMGSCSISAEFSTYKDNNTGTTASYANSLQHDLEFPYDAQGDNWNIPSVQIYDIWASSNTKKTVRNAGGGTLTYMFDNDDSCIVIPADGLYKIRMNVSEARLAANQSATVKEWYFDLYDGFEYKQADITITNDLQEDMPIEVQLVRNTDNCELIHGIHQWSRRYGRSGTKDVWQTAYPHEASKGSRNPSKSLTTTSSGFGGGRNTGTHGTESGNVGSGRRPRTTTVSGGTFGGTRSTSSRTYGGLRGYNADKGYMPIEGELLCYDPLVNSGFICGISSMSNGTPAVIKNGYSWNPSVSDKYGSKYNQTGYYQVTEQGQQSGNLVWTKTQYNQNALQDSTGCTAIISNDTLSGTIEMICELQKNDILVLKAVARNWESDRGNFFYDFDVNVQVDISAYSPGTVEEMTYKNRGWNSPSEFSRDLQLGEFMNKETKVSDFIQDFIKQFNLSVYNEGNVIYMNKQKLDDRQRYAVNIDDRVINSDVESALIEYPASMKVNYKIDTEEWGFETTVPAERLNYPDWAQYGDYGTSKVVISTFDDAKDETVDLKHSYTYYDTFKVLDSNNTELGTITIPVISKFSYMIDGYDYEESMKVDGKGLPIRYWFRGNDTGFTVNVNCQNDAGDYGKIAKIYDTKNERNGIELSYKDKEGTLLRRYFNINPSLDTNYIIVNCYLTAEEYTLLKKGANVIFDSDVYVVSEIRGYDPMGVNETELTLIKQN